LPPSGSSTVHIYTQTIHQMTQNKQYIKQQKNFWKSVARAPSLRVILWHLPYNWEKSMEKPLMSENVLRWHKTQKVHNVLLCQCSIRHLMWRHIYMLLSPMTQNCYKSTTTQYFYSVDSDIHLNNTQRMYCRFYTQRLCECDTMVHSTLPILQYYTSIFVYICQVFSSVQD
jgi:hypothetical protein